MGLAVSHLLPVQLVNVHLGEVAVGPLREVVGDPSLWGPSLQALTHSDPTPACKDLWALPATMTEHANTSVGTPIQ